MWYKKWGRDNFSCKSFITRFGFRVGAAINCHLIPISLTFHDIVGSGCFSLMKWSTLDRDLKPNLLFMYTAATSNIKSSIRFMKSLSYWKKIYYTLWNICGIYIYRYVLILRLDNHDNYFVSICIANNFRMLCIAT